MEIYGLGPWFIALLFNENSTFQTKYKGSKRTSMLILHTYAHKMADIHNSLNEHDNWIVMQLIGPFSVLSEACAFYKLWTERIRNKAPKILQGNRLFLHFHQQYGLTMWCQPEKREALLEKLPDARLAKRQKLEQTPVTYDIVNIDTIRRMQERRKSSN